MHLRRLNATHTEDRQCVEQLLVDSPDYTLRTFGHLPSKADADDLFSDFPVSCAPEHRLVFCIHKKETPVGLFRVLRAWPTPEVAVIGLLLIGRPYRRLHLGCKAVEHLSRQARVWDGISQWKLSVLESNPAGLAFWRHCGFEIGRQGLLVPGLAGPVTNMSRRVKSAVECKGPAAGFEIGHLAV